MDIKIIKQPDFSDSTMAVGLPFADSLDVIGGLYDSYTKTDPHELLSRLVKAGPEHAKAVRGTWVTLMISAPRYWWQEFDTYKVGVQTLSSTSSMHTITRRPFTSKDFDSNDSQFLDTIIKGLNEIIALDIPQFEKVRQLKKYLPESFIQSRLVQINYQALRNIYKQRKSHRLYEWHLFCDIIEDLPYAANLITV